MSDEEHLSPEDKELEAELSRLAPSRLKAGFIDELVRDHERISSATPDKPRRSKWLIPALATCTAVLCVTTFLRIQSASQSEGIAVQDTPPPARQTNDFVPISSEGYLINAASGGIQDSADGPRERFELRWEDFDHWHNPDTSTNIRIYTPRREIITVPVGTD